MGAYDVGKHGALCAGLVLLQDADLPPGRPSFITRVLGFDSGRFWVGQAAGRGAVRLLNRWARFCWRLVVQGGMQPDVVVVVAPEGQFALGIGQAVEDLLVQAFVAQAAIEWLDVAVLLRLSRIDVV